MGSFVEVVVKPPTLRNGGNQREMGEEERGVRGEAWEGRGGGGEGGETREGRGKTKERLGEVRMRREGEKRGRRRG